MTTTRRPITIDSALAHSSAASAVSQLTPRQELVDQDAQTSIESALSANTLRTYKSALKGWQSYAHKHNINPIPAPEAALMNYLQFLAQQGRTIGTIKLTASAISKAHALAELDSPTGSERFKLFLRGLTRRIGKPQRQASPLDNHALSAIEATACSPRRGRGGKMETEAAARARGLMDIAIVRTLSDAALRRSEAVALNWGNIQTDPRGAILTITRSKTDIQGKGATVWISPQALCALEAIRPADCNPQDPVFTSTQTTRNGTKGKYRMHAEQMSRRIAAAANAAGLKDHYSGHSGRVGFVARATRQGAPTDAIMRHARWKSPGMVAEYGRNETGAEILKYISS